MNILTLDIETSPHDAWSFNVWQTNIRPMHIKEPTRMLSWSAKFVGKSTVYYATCFDAHYLTMLQELMAQADIVVTYNGDKFDLKHINREFLENDLPPPRPCASVDMLKEVKRKFAFPHNTLDYVCSVILGESKLETGGFELWPAFMEQEPKALKVMKRYNIKDVRLTEKLYLHLRPWIAHHPHIGDIPDGLINDDPTDYTCEKCSSSKIELSRPRRTRCFAIRQVHCLDCGAWSDGKRKKL